MNDNVKAVKVIALIALVSYTFTGASWIRLLLIRPLFEEYLNSMNNSGLIFTPVTLIINSIGIVLIDMLGAIGALFILKRKEIGRKLFIAAILLWPVHDALWIFINMWLGMEVSLFVLNMVIGSIISIIVVKYSNHPKIKGTFEARDSANAAIS